MPVTRPCRAALLQSPLASRKGVRRRQVVDQLWTGVAGIEPNSQARLWKPFAEQPKSALENRKAPFVSGALTRTKRRCKQVLFGLLIETQKAQDGRGGAGRLQGRLDGGGSGRHGEAGEQSGEALPVICMKG